MDVVSMDSVAVLGPLGTYTHEAAYKIFGSDVRYIEKRTITDVFNALSKTVHLGVVPDQNSIFGIVVETHDASLKSDVALIRGEITLEIQHCLLAKKGVRLQDIEKVMSHEQALGQCSNFIAEYLPSASLVKFTSTAAAAQALLDSSPNCAAICSRICVSMFDGLALLQKGIQNEKVNFTKFYILADSWEVKIPNAPTTCRRHALLNVSTQLHPSPSSSGRDGSNIIQLLIALRLNVVRIDRRPSLVAVPFHDVYFVELQDDEDVSFSQPANLDRWTLVVNEALDRVRSINGEVKLLGIW